MQARRTPPDPAQADADNIQHERQLDEQGRASARAMGEAIRRLQIPIDQVLSSPTYRAQETVRLAQLGHPLLAAAADGSLAHDIV
jgi:phosphohistidine phosphatase SixA